jgi:hypothetical protein
MRRVSRRRGKGTMLAAGVSTLRAASGCFRRQLAMCLSDERRRRRGPSGRAARARCRYKLNTDRMIADFIAAARQPQREGEPWARSG